MSRQKKSFLTGFDIRELDYLCVVNVERALNIKKIEFSERVPGTEKTKKF